MPKQICRAAVKKMINPLMFRDTTNVAVPVLENGTVPGLTLSWIKSLVHQKDVLEIIIAYGRKLFKNEPFYIIHHEGFVFFCYDAWNPSIEEVLRSKIDFVKSGPVPGLDEIDLSYFTKTASLN